MYRTLPYRMVDRVTHRRSGAAMVEAALVLPIFFMVVLGIIEFGRAMMVGNLVTNAAREGARLGIISGSSNADVRNTVTSFLTTATNATTANITVTITVTAAPGNTNPGNECANAQAGDMVQVRVSIPFSAVSLIPGNYLSSVNLSSLSAMRHE